MKMNEKKVREERVLGVNEKKNQTKGDRDHIRIVPYFTCAKWKPFLRKCEYVDVIKNSSDEFSNEEFCV